MKSVFNQEIDDVDARYDALIYDMSLVSMEGPQDVSQQEVGTRGYALKLLATSKSLCSFIKLALVCTKNSSVTQK